MSEHDDRRQEPRGGDNDHDILIEIRSDLKNFVRRFNQHEEDEEEKFKQHELRQDTTTAILFSKTTALQKFQWLLAGGFVVVSGLLVLFAKQIAEAIK